MGAVDEQTSQLEHLDFDAPCGAKGCERTADFSIHCQRCKSVRLRCGECLHGLLEKNLNGSTFQCRYCAERAADYFALYSTRPLRP